jgi:protoheme IX farnesyltransferase
VINGRSIPDRDPMRKHLRILFELGKARVALLSTMTMVSGYILAAGAVNATLLWVTAGVFLLASGASGLNQVQERDIDSVMERTRGRPLPSRRVSLTHAVAMAIVSITAGTLMVLAAAGATAAALGLAAVAWYNGVYTPLKRVTAYAAVPGGVVGAIPPVIGWVSGGGWILDPRILAVAFFFFMWQVPHFWLLLMFSCGKDYEKAGLPSMTRAFSPGQIARITFAWVVAAATVCVLIPIFGGGEGVWVIAGLFSAGLWLVWRTAGMLRADGAPVAFRAAFGRINAYAVLVISLLSIAELAK